MENEFASQSQQEPLNEDAKLKREDKDDRMMAVIAHAGGIFFGFIPSLIIWLMKKDESPFISVQAKEALNFQISVAIYLLISSILILVLIGIFLIWAIYVVNVIFCIIAAIKAADGELYHYPLCIRLIK